MELSKVRERLAERGLKLVLTPEAKAFLVKKGSNLDFGARPLRRAIENFVEDPLSEELLKGEFKGMDTIHIEVREVGDKKQLYFHGTTGETPSRAAAGRRRCGRIVHGTATGRACASRHGRPCIAIFAGTPAYLYCAISAYSPFRVFVIATPFGRLCSSRNNDATKYEERAWARTARAE